MSKIKENLEYLVKRIIYQRGPKDYTLEEIITSTKTYKFISKRMFDVMVYDIKIIKGKKTYYYIPRENLEENTFRDVLTC